MSKVAIQLRLDKPTIAFYQRVAKLAGVGVNDVYCVVLALAAGGQKETAPKGRLKTRKKR